jgi:hypothetical protein
MDLDMYVYANVVDAPMDGSPDEIAGRLPAFSQKFGDCHLLLIKAMMELGGFTTELDPSFFFDAKKEGFILRKTPCPVWRITAGLVIAYGRSFEEALCKLLIVAKHQAG